MALTKERAQLAASTLEDVFTDSGDAVVIDRVWGARVLVAGRVHHGKWFGLSELTAREDL